MQVVSDDDQDDHAQTETAPSEAHRDGRLDEATAARENASPPLHMIPIGALST